MKTFVHQIIVTVSMLLAAASPVCAKTGNENLLVTYPVPQALLYRLHNDDYTVRVRTPGGEWQDLYEYKIRVDWHDPQTASMVYFDFKGTVELEIEKNNGRFTTVSIAPRDTALTYTRRRTLIHLALRKPARFSIQFDDDHLHNLHIMAGAPPAPKPDDPALIYYGPGVHVPPAGSTTFPVHSGDRIYLAGGAVLQGSFDLENIRDVKIAGRGLLYDPGRPIDLNGATDIDIRDLIEVNTDANAGARVINIRNSANVTLHDISGFTAGKWSDGINISTSQHITVDGGYLRTSDDAVVVYAISDCPICADKPIPAVGPPGSATPADTFDIRVRNLTIWNDVAHSLFIGHFGDNTSPRMIHDVSFENIDIANLDEDQPTWEGAMAIFSGDSTLIRNISFSHIRIDRIEEGKLFNFVAGQAPRYNTAPGRGIDGVTVTDVSYSGDGMPSRPLISGRSPTAAVKNVSIRGLRIAGKRITSTKAADLNVGPNVSGLTIH